MTMDDTGYYDLDRLPAKCANSYILDERTKQYYTNIYSVDVKGTGAGGTFTLGIHLPRDFVSLVTLTLFHSPSSRPVGGSSP